MPLTGPIKPRYYISYTSIAPNPDSETSSALNEIVQCPKTGRLWIQQAAAYPYFYQQVLPYVRNDGVPSQIATQFVNNNGQLKAQDEVDGTGGSVNLFDQITASADGLFTPNLPLETNATFDLIGRNATNELFRAAAIEGQTIVYDSALQKWRFQNQFETILASLSGDFTVSAANTSTFVTGMSLVIGGTGGAQSAWIVTVTCTGFHNGNWTLNAGIEMRDPAPNLGTVVVGASSVEGNGWLTVVVQAQMSCSFDNTQARMVVASSAAGALIKATPQFAFPRTGTYALIPDPFPNKSTRISATRFA
jgi:hypothetical protein